ncbi:DUF2220 family protein [Nocardioides sp. SOB44]|uniref:DUF2220 family protein n=1 Tax=Nocardioides cremeus TaxID=3058044 RepID=A0ABT8TM65_9ACTN|nr:Wadjet anti-phage system protein JetD domain-containing protein [Nocardioides cremeus]MDO3395059.1 DUF2220 family protein [Nocardioides cremeus]
MTSANGAGTSPGADTSSPPEAGSPALLSTRALRLAALLESVPGRTVPLPELWTLWATADPASVARPERRSDLAHAISQLAAAGLVTPSKKQDVAARPHLPVRLTLQAPDPSESAAAVARGIVWRPELSWAIRARLTIGQVEQLRTINSWLRDRGRDGDVVPLRERSLEVLGHEKALDSLLVTTVFGPDRLTLDHLRTFRTHPPLPIVRVGAGQVLLVIENDDTFHSIRTALSEGCGPVGCVAWGAGGAFEASVRSTGDLPGIERVRYFGDLDAAGLRIPRNAAETAAREDLPEVAPAHGLYRALLATAVRQGGQPPVPPDQAPNLTDWLADEILAEQSSDLLQAGIRVPQEALTLTALRSDRSWLHGL